MATMIQIVVAAGLLLAWIWVLGRALVSAILGRSGMAELDRGLLHQDRPRRNLHWPGWASFRDWTRRPPAVRRRQLLLANMFACFASFLLAVALRGRFVYLFGLMVLVLATHLAVASYLGGKILEARRLERVTAAKKQISAARGMSIRAPRALGDLGGAQPVHILADDLLARYPLAAAGLANGVFDIPGTGETGFDGISLDPSARGSSARGSSALDPSALGSSARGSSARGEGELGEVALSSFDGQEPRGVTSYVSELIEQVWGPNLDDVADPMASAGTADAISEPVPAADLPEVTHRPEMALEESVEPVASGETGDQPAEAVEPTEPIFNRPASQAPSRPRRKARPIYIHSQLDEVGYVPPRAVNDQ